MVIQPPQTIQNTLTQLLSWYIQIFVPQTHKGATHAVMNPTGATHKYSRKHEAITLDLLYAAFTGKQRRLPIDGHFISFPLSLAAVPQASNGTANAAIIDVDGGGREAIEKALHFASNELGLWGFAQLGESSKHTGGHLYFPTTEPMPSALLFDVAERIRHHLQLKGESYPINRDLRLPLMPHLRSPGGYTHFPLLLTDTQINTQDPLRALHLLRQKWQPSTPQQILHTLQLLPTPPGRSQPNSQSSQSSNTQKSATRSHTQRKPKHKSKVDPSRPFDVIRWFNRHHTIEDMLAKEGVQLRGNEQVTHCPWHKDERPSLAIWTHQKTGQRVCKCMSRDSGCPASENSYWDPFNVFCHINNLEPKDAVKQLCEEYNLGQKKTFQIESDTQERDEISELEAHFQRIDETRKKLLNDLLTASENRGVCSIFKGIPGIGKNHQGAQLALQLHVAGKLHLSGKRVHIVALNHENAKQEWQTRLRDESYVWKPKKELCTCHSKDYLQLAFEYGYQVPSCKADCPYQKQAEALKGKIGIFQHNHLHLNDGKRLQEADVIIIDEGIVDSLIEERFASQQDLHYLLNPLYGDTNSDPAKALLIALSQIGTDLRKQNRPAYGIEIIARLSNHFGGLPELQKTIESARTSQLTQVKCLPKENSCTSAPLQKQFFGKMLEALHHDALHPGFNTFLSWGQSKSKERSWGWLWSKRHEMLLALQNRIDSPAVIILDGSAQEAVYNKLLASWKPQQFVFDVPISPMVEIIQAPTLASTRRLASDNELGQRVIRQISYICNQLDLELEGGVTYKSFVESCEQTFGGTWLHYGGQKGSNALKGKKSMAVIASPTVPTDAIIRQTMALYSDEEHISLDWERKCAGFYEAKDPRLQAVNRLKTTEEFYQTLHRLRLILPKEKSTLLVSSPWPLEEVGLQAHRTITQLPHGNSSEARQAIEIYEQRTGRGGEKIGCSAKNEAFCKTGVKKEQLALGATIESLISQSPPPTSSEQFGQLNAVRPQEERTPSFDLSGSFCEGFFSKEALRSVEKEMAVDGFDSEPDAVLEGRGCKKGELLASAGEEAAPFNLTGLFFDSFFAEDSVSLCKVDCSCSGSGTASDFDFEAGMSAPELDTESNGEEAAPFNLTGLFFDSFFAEDSVNLCKDCISFRNRTFRDIPPLPLIRGEVFAFELEEVGKESSGPPGAWLRVWGPMSATLCQPGSSRPGGHNRHYPTPRRDKSWRPSNPRPPPVIKIGCVRVPSPLDHARESTTCQKARQETLAASPETPSA